MAQAKPFVNRLYTVHILSLTRLTCNHGVNMILRSHTDRFTFPHSFPQVSTMASLISHGGIHKPVATLFIIIQTMIVMYYHGWTWL